MFEGLELYIEILELRQVGLTEKDIEGYLSYFYDITCEDIH